MRKLMWFTIGFGGACAFCAYFYWDHLWLAALTGLLLGLAAWFAREKWKWMRCVVALFFGFSVGIGGFSLYETRNLSGPIAVDGQTVELTILATEYSVDTDYGFSIEGEVQLDDATIAVKVYCNEEYTLKPGDLIVGKFKLRATHGGSEEETFHRGDGIYLLCYQRDEIQIFTADRVPARFAPVVLRQNLISVIQQTFPEDVSFFARALLLGDRSGVDYEWNTAFKVSGISHIIAVSGLHVSMLVASVYLLCRRRRVLSAIIGIPLIVLFAAVAGFTPSITRACIMQILVMLALVVDREYDPPTALAFAALVMLIAEPLVITSVSFQLSVGCMAGIFLFSERIRRRIADFGLWKDKKGKTLIVRLRQWFSTGVAITLSAMFFTTPLVAYYFGAVSLVGILTNLLTIWAIGIIFNGIMVVCLLAFVWSWGAKALAWLLGWLMRYVLAVIEIVSDIPMAAVYTKSLYIVGWLIFCYILIALFLLLKNHRPMLLIACGVVGLCVALLMSWSEPLMGNYRVTIFDVGQGQCVLLQADGRNFLVDCGGDYDEDASDSAAETLLSMGIQRLDGLIVTHYDRDHAGGVAMLLSRVPADKVFLPESLDEEGLLPEIEVQCHGSQYFVFEDINLEWEDNSLTVFAPVSKKSGNESGLAVLFRAGNYDILITGDLSVQAETILVDQKKLPNVTALVVGHHGSKSSTGEKLLSALQPQYACISVGADNSYGHPSDSVLERLMKYGCVVHRTDEEGTIVFWG